MNATLSITGSVKGVDPQGFALVGGIAFAIAPAHLPKKDQIVKIEAHLDQAPQASDEQPVWTATSVIVFDMPQDQSAAPVAVPQRTDHHNTVATPATAPQAAAPTQRSAAPAPAPVATKAAAPVRFGLSKQTPAAPGSAKAIANQAVTAAATSSRFSKPAQTATATPNQSTGRFGIPAATGARPAASAPQSARPPFVASAPAKAPTKTLDEFTDDDIPF